MTLVKLSTAVPGCLQSADLQVSVSGGVTGKSFRLHVVIMCTESGWKCIPLLHAAVSSAES